MEVFYVFSCWQLLNLSEENVEDNLPKSKSNSTI